MSRIAKCSAAALLSLGLVAAPATADDFLESVEAAVEAYNEGDIKAAKEEIDFAAQLLAQMKAEGLAAFLPEPMEGWEREVEEPQSMAALGGGQMATAIYTRGAERVEIQLMAGNQMVTALGAMFSNSAMLGAMGKVKRINRQKVVVTPQGELQTMINQVMVQITGSTEDDIKEDYFAEIDVEALEDF